MPWLEQSEPPSGTAGVDRSSCDAAAAPWSRAPVPGPRILCSYPNLHYTKIVPDCKVDGRLLVSNSSGNRRAEPRPHWTSMVNSRHADTPKSVCVQPKKQDRSRSTPIRPEIGTGRGQVSCTPQRLGPSGTIDLIRIADIPDYRVAHYHV
jgi:hypothetical protein